MPEIRIPEFLSYSCIACGDCCRLGLEVNLTENDYVRLSKYSWAELYPELEGLDLFVRYKEKTGQTRYRIRPRRDGACPFLNAENKCLIHAHVGEDRKPLACQLFPYTFAHTPAGVHIGCRFNCPSVVGGRGRPLSERREEISKLFRKVRDEGLVAREPEEAKFCYTYRLSWPHLLDVEAALMESLQREELSFAKRLMLCGRIVQRLRASTKGAEESETVGLSPLELCQQLEAEDLERPRLKLFEKVTFNQALAHFYNRTGAAFRYLPLWQRSLTRMRRVLRQLKFILQMGTLRVADRRVKMKGLRRVSSSALDRESTRVLTRYFQAKIHGQSFFASQFFGYSFVEGLTFMVLLYSCILWYAKAFAAAAGRTAVERRDLEAAIRFVDPSFSAAGPFGGAFEKIRLFLLADWHIADRVALHLSG